MELPLFKIRAHNAIEILGNIETITPKQLEQLDALQKKEKRTEKQEQALQELIAKRDAKPELSAGAKAHCELWLKQVLYKRKREFSSKYTEKGIECEQEAIDMVSERMGYGMVFKNTKRVSDEYMEGEADLVLTDIIEEIKNSWDFQTFPLFATAIPEKKYEIQNKIYMHLYEKPKGAVNYVLIDTPEHIIDREAKIQSLKAGFSEVDMELYDEVHAKLTYSDIPKELRIKRFELEPDPKLIEQIKERVVLCREYIAELYSSIMNNSLTIHEQINGANLTVFEKV